MHYPEYYQVAWIIYCGVTTSLFLLWWWAIYPFETSLKAALLLLYVVIAWTPVALSTHQGVWVPAIAVTVFGGWMDGQAQLIRGLTPILFAAFVSIILLTLQAFFIRAKRD